MARKPLPWYWPERNAWFTILNGKRQSLGDHPADAAPPQKRKGRWVIPAFIQQAFHDLLSAKTPPRPKPSAGPTVADVFDRFLDWCQKHREARTYADYLDYIQKFLDHLKGKANIPVAELRPFHIVEWVDSHEGWNDTTRRKAIIHIQRPFNFAAIRHMTTYKQIAEGNQAPDGERHLELAMTRLAFALWKSIRN